LQPLVDVGLRNRFFNSIEIHLLQVHLVRHASQVDVGRVLRLITVSHLQLGLCCVAKSWLRCHLSVEVRRWQYVIAGWLLVSICVVIEVVGLP
jgi:hypothetical protein